MMLKAVIFDMDGVLVDSERFHKETEIEIFRKHGVKTSWDELSSFTGMADSKLFEHFIREHSLDVTPEQLADEKTGFLMESIKGRLRCMPGAVELIRNLKGRDVKIGLATSSKKRVALGFLDELGIRSSFDSILTADEVQNAKPDPEIYRKASETLDAKPEECIVIEDSGKGIKAARSAGIACIGLKSADSINQDLGGADLIIESLEELDNAKIRELIDKGDN